MSYKKGKNSQVVKVMAESQSLPRAKASFYLKVFIELNKWAFNFHRVYGTRQNLGFIQGGEG